MIKALDLSYATPDFAWWQARKADGFELMVQDLWNGGARFPNAEANLTNARNAGLQVAGYVALSDQDPAHQVGQGVLSAASALDSLAFIAIDLELPLSQPESQIQSGIEAVQTLGKPYCIYTATWAYERFYAGTQIFKRHPVWYANYNFQETIDFPYWAGEEVIAHQYQGDTDIEGQHIDLNVFDAGWLGLGEDMTPEEHDRLVNTENAVARLEAASARNEQGREDIKAQLAELKALLEQAPQIKGPYEIRPV